MLEEHAFRSQSLPCNSLPFINRLKEILQESETNSMQLLRYSAVPQSAVIDRNPENRAAWLKCKAVMWVLMAQLYGEPSLIQLGAEWDELDRLYTQGVF